MITCPRCGGQAPDGTPWCPYCGYGKPPVQQMQQSPAQYKQAIPEPKPEPPKPKNKTARGCLVLAFICLCIVAIFIMLLTPNKKAEPTATPTVAITNTEQPSRTPAPSRTPYPTATARPESCNIKGNRNTKIYHCKNSPYYDTTDDFIRWFCSSEEAEAEGYRPPSGVNWCEQ